MTSDSEYMDIVDEFDEVVGCETRAKIHARYEIHRGVHVFVVNSAGELLLQKRSEISATYPGYWDASVGGQVASGETYLAAALRELREELGCHAETLQLVGKYDSYSSRQREKRALFVYPSEGPFLPAPAEIEAIKFAAITDVVKASRVGHFTEGFQRSFALWTTYMAERKGE